MPSNEELTDNRPSPEPSIPLDFPPGANAVADALNASCLKADPLDLRTLARQSYGAKDIFRHLLHLVNVMKQLANNPPGADSVMTEGRDEWLMREIGNTELLLKEYSDLYQVPMTTGYLEATPGVKESVSVDWLIRKMKKQMKGME